MNSPVTKNEMLRSLRGETYTDTYVHIHTTYKNTFKHINLSPPCKCASHDKVTETHQLMSKIIGCSSLALSLTWKLSELELEDEEVTEC